MGTRQPRVTAGNMIRVIEQLGFELARSSGSHRIYKNATGVRVTVPFHAGKILHPKIVKTILEDVGLSTDEFIEIL